MFSFNYKGVDGNLVPAAEELAVLAKTKGLMSLSQSLGKVKAVDFDATKRGMCDLRKKHLRSVDALAIGRDNRLYFIDFKDRNLWRLNSQGRNSKKEVLIEDRNKKKKDKSHLKRSKDKKASNSEQPIDVELSGKMFDSILLTGLGDEQWCSVDFCSVFGKMLTHDIAGIRANSVFVLVYNDKSYDKDATIFENRIMEAGSLFSGLKICDDPQIHGAKIYWGLEQFSEVGYYAEVHTLNLEEFEAYALNRFISL